MYDMQFLPEKFSFIFTNIFCYIGSWLPYLPFIYSCISCIGVFSLLSKLQIYTGYSTKHEDFITVHVMACRFSCMQRHCSQ